MNNFNFESINLFKCLAPLDCFVSSIHWSYSICYRASISIKVFVVCLDLSKSVFVFRFTVNLRNMHFLHLINLLDETLNPNWLNQIADSHCK